MFTVAQFFENQQLRVLAVPASWVREGHLMWPKLPSNGAVEKMRVGGVEFHGATKKISAITSRKYKTLKAAEAAAEELLKNDISDIEVKRELLTNHKKKSSNPKQSKDYNSAIQKIASSAGNRREENPATTIAAGQSEVKEVSIEAQIPKSPIVEPSGSASGSASGTTSVALPSNEQLLPTSLLQLTQDQGQRTIYVCEDGTLLMNQPNGSIGAAGNPPNVSYDELKLEIESVKSEMAQLKTDMNQMKHDIIDAVTANVREIIEEALEKNLPRFATMLDMTSKVEQHAPQGQEETSVEDHKPINDENDLTNFNKLLANGGVFKDYVKYFSKIIIPDTYAERGDSAFYILADCLFTRTFWDNFTWTGINRGSKSKRGFREFGNVLQLLLTIVRAGDETYTIKNVESFCKEKLFRYSKARATSKQLRKPSCRQKRKIPEGNGNDDEDDDEVNADKGRLGAKKNKNDAMEADTETEAAAASMNISEDH